MVYNGIFFENPINMDDLVTPWDHENPINMDDLGTATISGNLHMDMFQQERGGLTI